MEQKDVIQIDNDMSLVNKVFKEGIHEGLKGGWGVTKPKCYDEGFKEAKRGFKSGFSLIAGFYANVVITRVQVELGKIAGTA